MTYSNEVTKIITLQDHGQSEIFRNQIPLLAFEPILMKQIYTLLTGALILAGQLLYAQQTIQSTPAGGAWGSPDTWVGNVVPTAADNVVINGTVSVPVGIICNDLTINGTLVDNASECSGVGTRHVVVNGNLVNNGSILLQGQYYCGGTKLELRGNIENNGTWTPFQVFFAGSADQFISTSANACGCGATPC